MDHLIAALALVLACAAIWLWTAPVNASRDQGSTEPESLAPTLESDATALAPFQAPPPTDFSEMTQRPLFSDTRRPPAVMAPSEQRESPPLQPLDASLRGVVLTGDADPVAIVTDRMGATHSVTIGDSVDAWQVVEIRTGLIVLEIDGRRETLELHRSIR